MTYTMSYAGAGVTPPAVNTPNDATFFHSVFDHIFAQHNSLSGNVLVKDASGGGSLASLSVAPTAAATGVNVAAGSSYTGRYFAASKTGSPNSFAVNNDFSVSALAFHGSADSALGLANTTLGGTQNQLLAFNGTTWAPSFLTTPMISRGAVDGDKIGDLFYTPSPTPLRVRVASGTVWSAGTPIFFPGGDSATIDLTGIGSSQARIDLLYIDGSGALQWAQGTAASAASAGLPPTPSSVFVPVVYVKTYSGATSITGYDDQGHDSFFYRNARTGNTTPAIATAIPPHSLSITRLSDGAVYASTPASPTINFGALLYYNSANQQLDVPATTYTYDNTQLLDTQPRWDMFYMDDGGVLNRTPGTPSATPAKPIFSTGQWVRAFVYIPGNLTSSIVDEANWTPGSTTQGYIHFAPAYLAGNAPATALTTATGTVSAAGSVVTGVTVTNPTSNGIYSTPPAVVFTGGTGTAATATANLVNGRVTTVTITSGGNYSVLPTGVSFSATGGVIPVSQGGTGGTTQASGRSGLGAAATGTNADITSMTALTGITGNVTVTGNTLFTSAAVGNTPVTVKSFAGQTAPLLTLLASDGTTVLGQWDASGNLGQGRTTNPSVGFIQGGTLTSTNSNAFGIAQNQTLKPGLFGGGQGTFIAAANVGTIDLSALTGVGDNLPNAYGVYVGAVARTGSNPSVYAVNTITPTGTLSGGSFTISDGTNTTAAINPTAAVGDTVTTGTINYALSHATPAAVAYTATGAGPLSGGNTITLTANTTTNPGRKAALTMPTNAPTGGGSLAIAQTYPGAPYIGNAYGGYFSQPTGGVRNYALYSNGLNYFDASNGAGLIDGSWADGALYVSKVLSQSKNEAIMSIQGVSSGTTSNGTQRNGLIVFVTNNDQSNLFGTPAISRDLVAGDFQAFVGASNPQGRVWALNLQTSILGTTPGSDGTTVIAEARVDNNGVDGQYIGQSAAFAFQKVGFNMIGRGPRMATAAYMVTQTTPNIWHHGFWADVSAIGTGANDTAFEVGSTYNATTGTLIAQGTYAVRGNGRTTIGSNQPSGAGYMLDVYGEGAFRQTATNIPAIAGFGRAAASADVFNLNTTPFNANAQTIGVDRSGHHYKSQAAVPTTTAGAGAGTSPTFAFRAGSTDQEGQIQITIGSAPTAGAQTVVTVNFQNAMTNTPKRVIIAAGNGTSVGAIGAIYCSAATTSGFVISTTTTLTAAGVYWLWYSVE